MNLSIRKQLTEAYASRRCQLGTPARRVWHIEASGEKRRRNERALSSTAHSNQLKLLAHIHSDGVTERESFLRKHKNREDIWKKKGQRYKDWVQLREIVSCSSESSSSHGATPQILLSAWHQSSQKPVKHLRAGDYTTVVLRALQFLWQRKDFCECDSIQSRSDAAIQVLTMSMFVLI